MAASDEADAGEEAGCANREAAQTSSEYYNDWERYAKAEEAAAKEVEDAEEEEKRRRQMNEVLGKPSSNLGYEFRKGAKVRFPEIVLEDGEGDDEAAWRVAMERRESGNESFREGTIWGAQTAVDAWGQGLLCLTRIRNLRKGRVKKAVDDAKKALENAPPKSDQIDWSSPAIWEEIGWTGTIANSETTNEDAAKSAKWDPTVIAAAEAVKDNQTGPTDAEVENLVCTLQMNVAQGLLKLGQFEASVGHCDAAIAIDPTNKKALWRKAQAVWGTRNPGLAREALDALLKVDPDNPAALGMLREIEVEEARKRKKRTGVAPPKPTFKFPTSGSSAAPEASAQVASGDAEASEQVTSAVVKEASAADVVATPPSGTTELPGGAAAQTAEATPLLPPHRRPAWWSCCRRKCKPA